jgi:hypothetical protein
LLRNRLPVLVQTRAQFARVGLSRRFTCGDGDIDRRQGVLIQTEGFSCEALDSIARDRGAEDSRRDTQPQSRITFMIGQDRQTKKCIGKFFTAALDFAKFGRLVQTLARLERQPLD